MYKKLKKEDEKKQAVESDWEIGIWLGRTRASSEVLIGTEKGVARAWAVKRLASDEQWSAERIKKMTGTPQQPDPSKAGSYIPIRVGVTLGPPAELPEMRPPRKEEAPRRTYLKPEDFGDSGYTANCEGCRRMNAGMSHRPHSKE